MQVQRPQAAAGPPAVVSARAAVIESGFGTMWFGWGQESPPSWLVPVLAVGSVACLVTVVVGVVLLVRRRRPPGPPPAGIRSRYWLLVLLEAVLGIVGASVVARTGHPELIAAWVSLVVGAHFVPLASIFPGRGLVGLGVVVVAVAVVAAVVTLTVGGTSSTIAGPGAGLCLLVHSVALLLGVARDRGRGAPDRGPEGSLS